MQTSALNMLTVNIVECYSVL